MKELLSRWRWRLQELHERWQDRPLRPQTRLRGRYVIETCLGMGSYGISYLCRDEATGEPVVLKQVKPSKRKGSKGRPIYDYETGILERIDHPSIPKLRDRFEEKGQLFFAMDYKSGKNFEDVIFDDGQAYGERESLEVILELLDIVEHLHAQGIVHRDVRIPNVILADGRLHLIDFGLARRLGDKPTQVAEDLLDYEAEKQIKRAVSFTSDFYSMGHFLLFLLYSGYEAEETEEPKSWQDELPVTPQTRELLERMLQIHEPYPDAQSMRSDVQRAIRSVPASSRLLDEGRGR